MIHANTHSAIERLHETSKLGKKMGYVATGATEISSVVSNPTNKTDRWDNSSETDLLERIQDRKSFQSSATTGFESFGAYATDDVKEAWAKAAVLTGINSFGGDTPTHLSGLYAYQASKLQLTGSKDVLGKTNDSAIDAVKQAQKYLEKAGTQKSNAKVEEYRALEKTFYENFLSLMNQI